MLDKVAYTSVFVSDQGQGARLLHEREWLAERFEERRRHLRAVAYRMLGSLNEADDAVQAWLRLSRQDAAAIDNLGGWLTTVVARVCLNELKASRPRRRRRRVRTPLGRAGARQPRVRHGARRERDWPRARR